MNQALATNINTNEQTPVVEQLRRVALFKEIKDEPGSLEMLAGIMTKRTFAAGENILVQGESGSDMYILCDGKVDIFRMTLEGDQFIVASLSGEHYPFFGEATLLDEDSRSATIRAVTECLCLALDRKDFEKFSQNHPPVGFASIKAYCCYSNGQASQN